MLKVTTAVAAAAVIVSLAAQGPPPAPQTSPAQAPPATPSAQGRGRGNPGVFPAQQRPPGDPAVVARGKALFGGAGGGGAAGGGPNAPNPRAVTVAVTLPSGEKVEGRLLRIDDFFVSLTEAGGTIRSFTRTGARPRVEMHDPLEPHRALLSVYTDKDMHDVTAYLATLK